MGNKLLLSINDAAEVLSVSRGTVYNLLEAGAIKRVKIGSAARITMDSLKSYIASLENIAN